MPVALVIMKRRNRTVYRNFVKIRTAETLQLRVGIGKKSSLKQRIIRKINARNYVTEMKRDLFGFGKKIVRVAIQGQFADSLDRNQFFGNNFCRIEQIEFKLVFVFFGDKLYAEFPFGKIAVFNRFPQIAAVKIRVFTGDFLCFVPRDRVNASVA